MQAFGHASKPIYLRQEDEKARNVALDGNDERNLMKWLFGISAVCRVQEWDGADATQEEGDDHSKTSKHVYGSLLEI